MSRYDTPEKRKRHAARQRRYYKAHVDEMRDYNREYQRKYRAKHVKKLTAYRKRYYAVNRKRILAYSSYYWRMRRTSGFKPTNAPRQ